MALPATDAFTGVDGTELTAYSANWTQNDSAAFAINTNAIYSTTNDHGAHWNADAFDNDQYAQIKLVALAEFYYIGPAARCAASAITFYGIYSDLVSSYGFKFSGGVYTELFTDSGASRPALNDTIRVEVSGTTINYKKNGVAYKGPYTDETIVSGSAGIVGYGNSATTRGDNWEGGNLVTAAVFVFKRIMNTLLRM